MTFKELVHCLRAVYTIYPCDEYIIVGSQSILGSLDYPPPESLLESTEIDIYFESTQEEKEKIFQALGEYSDFHSSFGYYVDPVNLDEMILPNEWKKHWITRFIDIQDQYGTILTVHFISLPDIAASKLYAQRPKDLTFIEQIQKEHLITDEEAYKSIKNLPIDEKQAASQMMIFKNAGKESQYSDNSVFYEYYDDNDNDYHQNIIISVEQEDVKYNIYSCDHNFGPVLLARIKYLGDDEYQLQFVSDEQPELLECMYEDYLIEDYFLDEDEKDNEDEFFVIILGEEFDDYVNDHL